MKFKPENLVGTQIDQFKLDQYVAKGSMGVVFKAFDTVLVRTVALKLIPKLIEEGLSVEELSAREEARKRLIQEAKAAGRLAHPNIVTIHSYGETDEFEYICMEYVGGKTLSQVIKEHNVISIEEAVPIVEQILLALVAANQEHIVHRDIKPSNVMMTNDNRVKVMDFGIAKLPSLSMTLTGMVLGTPYYMSPEQISGQKVDIRSDLFSVGAVFYEMVTGARPFEAENTTTLAYKIVQVEPIPPRVLNLHVPDKVGNIISRALVKDPGRRYQTPDEMLRDLQALKNTLISEEINAAEATVVAVARDFEKTVQYKKPAAEKVERETDSTKLPPVVEPEAADQQATTFAPAPMQKPSPPGKTGVDEPGVPAATVPPPPSPKTEQLDRESPGVQHEGEKDVEERQTARPGVPPKTKKEEAAAKAMVGKQTTPSRALLIVSVLVLAAISGIFLLFRGSSRSPQDTSQTSSVKQNAADLPVQQQSAIPPPPLPDPSQIAMQVNSLIIEAQGLWQTNPVGAQKALENAVSLDPNSFEAVYQLARFLTQKKDFPAAIQQYKKALYLNSQVHEVYFNLGNIYLAQGDYQSAIESYQSCRGLNPPYQDEVLTNLGIIELKRKNTTEARLLFQQALNFNPKNGSALNYLNKLSTQDTSQTSSIKQNAVDLPVQSQPATQPPPVPDPSQIAMQVNSLIVEAQGLWQTNPRRAQKALEEAASLDPNSFEAVYQLARFLTQKKDFPAAIQQYKKALSLNSQAHEVYFNLGYIYLTQGDYQSAKKSYQSCRGLNPPYQDEVLTNLGIIELKRNNPTEARLLFEQALNFNPKNGLARLSRDRLLPQQQSQVGQSEVKKKAPPSPLSAVVSSSIAPVSDAVFKDSVTGMEFIHVPGGCFQMGDTFGDGQSNGKPVHEVCVDGFYMGKYEVTQDEYSNVIDSDPSEFNGMHNNPLFTIGGNSSKKSGRYPVESIKWDDIHTFISKLTERSGKNYRLPTEAEWEYAARSGGREEKYAGGDDVDSAAWYAGNSGRSTHPVGQKQPNGLGLYDMSGNVWEWCSDKYDENYYKVSVKDNPTGPSSWGFSHTIRGGSFTNGAKEQRSTYRLGTSSARSNVGFRLVLPAQRS